MFGDKVLMLENAIYSILSPEGYATILWKDASRAKEAANIMKLTSDDLYELEVIDKIIKEPQGGAQKDIQIVSNRIKKEILTETKNLNELSINKLLEERYNKFRNIGNYINI